MMARQAAAGRRILALLSILMVAWAGPAIGGMAELGRGPGDKGDGKGKIKTTLNPDFEVFSSICNAGAELGNDCDPRDAASPCIVGGGACVPGSADQLLEVLKDKINAPGSKWTAFHAMGTKEISVIRNASGLSVSIRLESTDRDFQRGKTASPDDFPGNRQVFVERPRLSTCIGGNDDGRACADSSECSGGGACPPGVTAGGGIITVQVDANLPALALTAPGWDANTVLNQVKNALNNVPGKTYTVQSIENGRRLKISGADSVEWDHTDAGITGFALSATGPPAGVIPTLSEWGILLLVLLLGTAAMLILRRGHRETGGSSPG